MPSPDKRNSIPQRRGAEGKVLRAALGSTLNLSLLGVGSAAAGALSLGLGPVVGGMTLALSAVTYGALVGLDLFNPKFVEKTLLADRPGPAPATTAVEVESAELRAQLDAVRAANHRVVSQIDGMGGVFTDALQEIAVRAATLVEEAARMASESNTLVRYLADGSEAALRAEADKLEKRAFATRDAEAASGFRQAAEARRSQLRTRDEMAALVERLSAQLSLIETALDEMRARLVKMGAQDAGDVENVGRSMVGRLTSLRQEVGVLETSIADISETVKGVMG